MKPEPKPGLCKKVSVVRVIDADTIEVQLVWNIKIRLLGPSNDKFWMDAPEKNTPEGQAAIARILEVLTNPEWMKDPKVGRFKEATLFIPSSKNLELLDITTFDRVLGELWVDGKCLGDLLVEEGIAKLRPKNKKAG